MTITDKIIISLLILNTFFFFVLAGTVYGVRNNNEHLQQQITLLTKGQDSLFLLSSEHAAQLEINSSRIDIVDSAVLPDAKRRMLVTKIRNAITENTYSVPDVRTLNRIANAVADNSFKYNLPVANILAQIRQESSFNTVAKSVAGAEGLMQIMPETKSQIEHELGRRFNSWDIYHNIEMGCYYMSEQLNTFKNYDDALRAYNAGPMMVHKVKAGDVKEYMPETNAYIAAISGKGGWISVFKKYGLE